MQVSNKTIQDLREAALAASEAHLLKVRGRSPKGKRVAFGVLALPEIGYVEGDLGLPGATLQLTNELLQILVWKGQSKQLQIMNDRKAFDIQKLDGYATHRWVVNLPDDPNDPLEDFHVENVNTREGGVRIVRREERQEGQAE